MYLPTRKQLLADFKLYVRREIRKTTPIPHMKHDLWAWLERCNYPMWRKLELASAWDDFIGSGGIMTLHCFQLRGVFKVKSFVKDESYTKFKHARSINSRSDIFKCFMGPYIKAIEDIIYKDPMFIKHVPVRDRPRVIHEELAGPDGILASSDWDAMEAQFKVEMMEACEKEVLDWMLSYQPREVLNIIWKAKASMNKCDFGYLMVKILATRMSGEMDTSLSNGITNKFAIKFLCSLVGSTVKGFVEGDDGLFRISGEMPPTQLFRQLGISVKVIQESDIQKASFCGCVYSSEFQIATDPVSAALDLFWGPATLAGSNEKVRKSYLRAKALSMAHQYPGCPILGSLSRWALTNTKGMDIRNVLNSKHISQWEREQLVEASKFNKKDLYQAPTLSMRQLVEETYGIPVEAQLTIERLIDNSGASLQVGPLCEFATDDQKDFYDNYVVEVPRNVHSHHFY